MDLLFLGNTGRFLGCIDHLDGLGNFIVNGSTFFSGDLKGSDCLGGCSQKGLPSRRGHWANSVPLDGTVASRASQQKLIIIEHLLCAGGDTGNFHSRIFHNSKVTQALPSSWKGLFPSSLAGEPSIPFSLVR